MLYASLLTSTPPSPSPSPGAARNQHLAYGRAGNPAELERRRSRRSSTERHDQGRRIRRPHRSAHDVGHHDRLPALLFFFNDTATTEIYTLSLHDALPI